VGVELVFQFSENFNLHLKITIKFI